MNAWLIPLVAVFAAALWGQRPSVNVEGAVYSQYIWRGLIVTDGPVLQTSTTADYKRLYLNVWTNQDLTETIWRAIKLGELYFDGGYDHPLGERTTISSGVILYTFPNAPDAPTTELYTGVSFETTLKPSVRAYFDVQSVKGVYLTFDVGHVIPMPELRRSVKWGVELAAGVGWGSKAENLGYFGAPKAGLSDVHPTVALPFEIGPKLRIVPKLGYAAVLCEPLRHSGARAAHGFFGGASVDYTF